MRGCGMSRSACGASSSDRIPTLTSYFYLLTSNFLGLARQRRDELIALVQQLLARTAAVGRPDRVLTEEREGDRRIAVRDDGVGQHARIDLAPAHGFGRRRAGQSAPDDLVGRDLYEVVVAAFGDAVHLPQRRLRLQVEILRRAAAENHTAVLFSGEDDRADLVHVLV